jgi:hypothetical protein
MATITPSLSPAPHAEHPPDITIYSHAPLLYWWPAWAVAFAMALWTYLDGRYMALVPEHTAVEGNRLVAPAGEQLEAPVVRVARSPLPGALFVATLLVIAFFSSASLRGPWTLFFGASVVALVFLFSWLQWWQPLYQWLRLLRIHINLGGYLTFALPLFVVWLLTVFVLDRRTYLTFSAGQVRIGDRLGRQERAFDAMSVVFEKQPYDWFRRLVGWGAGDLVLRAGPGRDVYELPNVVHIAKWLRRIETRLKTRDVE